MKNGIFNIKRIFKALGYSWQGLRAVFSSEAAFKQELIASIVLIPAAFFIGTSAVARALLIFAWVLVLIAELINSAIETVVNRISNEHHELSGKAKNIGSAVVLLAILNAAAVWGIIFVARFF